MPIGFDKNHPLNAPKYPVMATIVTANLDLTLEAYQSVLGYELVTNENLSANMANHWDLADLAGARLAVLQPKSGVPVFLRFLEIEDAERPERPVGWFALEICVSDVEALYDRLIEGDAFQPFAKPMPLAFTDRVYPMQCKGPSGEILYLNQVRGSLPDIDLPIASSFVDHLFIAILSAPDMEGSIEFYSELLGVSVNERHEIAYKTINRVHELPLDTHHKLETLGAPRHVGLEIDEYPSTSERPDFNKPEIISEGILMVSFAMSSVGDLTHSEIRQFEAFDTGPYKGAKSLVIRGPANERIEIIEIAK